MQPAMLRTLRLLLAPAAEVQSCVASARAAHVSTARCFAAPPALGPQHHQPRSVQHRWSTETAAARAFVRLLEQHLALVRALLARMGTSIPETLCRRWCSAQERLLERSLRAATQHRDTCETVIRAGAE